jgi:hypothetical protein
MKYDVAIWSEEGCEKRGIKKAATEVTAFRESLVFVDVHHVDVASEHS